MSYRVVTVHVYASPGSEIEIGYVDTGYASRYLANAQALGMRKLGHDDFLIVQDNGRNGFVAVFDASDLGRHHPEDDGFIAEALGLKWSGPNPPESQAPEPTALDAGGSEGMETAPPAVTIPEDQRWCWVGGDPLVMPWQFKRREAAALGAEVMRSGCLTRLVTADEWDAICADRDRLARIDAARSVHKRLTDEYNGTPEAAVEIHDARRALAAALDGAS